MRTVLAVTCLALATLIAAGLLAFRLLPDRPPRGFGNADPRLEKAPLGARPGTHAKTYRLGVIGDTQGADVADRLMRDLFAAKPDLVVIAGDLVRKGRAGHHRVAAGWLASLAPFPCPVAVTMGNRDLKRPEFDVPDWERLYGPSNTWFSFGGDLFVVTRYADASWPVDDSFAYLEGALAAQRARHRRAFVITHVPPPGSQQIGFHCMRPDHGKRVRELARRYRIDYWISGHYHGYVRREDGGTVFLTSGGGGGGLHQPGGGHHALLLEVGEDGVTQRRLDATAGFNLSAGITGILVGEIGTEAARRPGAAAAVLLLAGLGWGLSRRAAAGAPRARPAAGSPGDAPETRPAA